ncbi:MAG: PhnA domain-containing protein [Rhodobacteraceae bacterium]|nr:PhnA domain-containing protein [Paracoccaceae bacterium]
MSLETELQNRSGTACELCNSTDNLAPLTIGPDVEADADHSILACSTCRAQIEGTSDLDLHHWLCLQESAWSQVPPVQVAAYRMLNKLPSEVWARDLLDMIYLDEETLAWANAGQASEADDADAIVHKDTHGAVLSAGDTVTLIKDLKVKGANFTAKRGTSVRNISLVHDNAEHIEGRVNDQRIVILTEFVKKA